MGTENKWKYRLGMTLFIGSFAPYFVGAILFLFHIQLPNQLTFFGVLIAVSELAFIASIALLGKEFIKAIKAKIHKIFKIESLLQPAVIGKIRHRLGIFLLILSSLPYLISEISLLLGYPRGEQGRMWLLLILLLGDVAFISSLFVFGEDFCERLKKLFEYKEIEKTSK